jgi:type I restriction enzyme M protein
LTIHDDLDAVFKDPNIKHSLDLFKEEDVERLQFKREDSNVSVFCTKRERWIKATPEEVVRQLYLKRLVIDYGYPLERIVVEKDVWFGSGVGEKRADIVVFHKDLESPYIIVEVKKPERRDGEQQLKSYCNAEGSPIGVWTNGKDILVLHREEPNTFIAIDDVPSATQSLSEIISEKKTLDDLEPDAPLKEIILNLEDLVLANAGVDAFEEVFKLIYAKLYDELQARQKADRVVTFRIAGESPSELYTKINGLFTRASEKWRGVFRPFDKIDLKPTHLMSCVSFLQKVRLFNSNLQVIDEAFEYLITQVAKGSKGQYFTPRYVIDMAVKMLNPKPNEYMIDPASGSCGFTVHSIFWVWGKQITGEPPKGWMKDYASEMVYAIDFDDKAVKIAKAVNLIAGDGKTNVYKLNSLDPSTWDDEGKGAFGHFLTRFEDNKKDEENQRKFKYFNFDVLMTNPPFAGDLSERQILREYQLAENKEGKMKTEVGRDILFIERCLNFLRPGGRMTIVLPQGRFNNSTDVYIREFIMERARILAVISIGGNSFKPHTGTKTSLLFLQKWNDDQKKGPLCPFKQDYPIFFATSQKSGKNSAGDYIYKTKADGSYERDSHGHLIYDHDLDDIATSFVEFAKAEKLSFRAVS